MDINSIYQESLKPSDDLLSDIARLDGDILILGVGAGWINAGGKTLNKPTHFEEREGKF